MTISDMYQRKRIRRFFETGEVREMEDDVLNEFRIQIRLDGEDFIQAVISPSLFEEFVLGFLLTRGIIEGPRDVSSLEIAGDTVSVTRIPRLRHALPDLRLLESSGTRNWTPEQIFRLGGKKIESELRVPAKVLIKALRLIVGMPVFEKTGATHCAILFSPSGEVICSAEDVGRHNSVDKVIGGGLIKGVDFGRSWLAVSGRLPADMVLKPLAAGIPLIASVSAATSDGIDMGELGGVTVVGFTRGGRLNCYCHPERIT
ncbi:MAG: formate dehydrogenase accessory sulfurtransferase FdhD [Pseudomonadota bacterium]